MAGRPAARLGDSLPALRLTVRWELPLHTKAFHALKTFTAGLQEQGT